MAKIEVSGVANSFFDTILPILAERRKAGYEASQASSKQQSEMEMLRQKAILDQENAKVLELLRQSGEMAKIKAEQEATAQTPEAQAQAMLLDRITKGQGSEFTPAPVQAQGFSDEDLMGQAQAAASRSVLTAEDKKTEALKNMTSSSARFLTPELLYERTAASQRAKQDFPTKTGEQLETEAGARAKGSAKAAALKALDSYSSDAVSTLAALDKLTAQTHELGDFKRGLLPQISEKIGINIKEAGKDEAVTRYIGVVNQELIPLARKLMEEKGPITESDVNRVEKGLGDITTPIADKLFLINQLRQKIQLAIANKAEAAEVGSNYFTGQRKVLGNLLGIEGSDAAPSAAPRSGVTASGVAFELED